MKIIDPSSTSPSTNDEPLVSLDPQALDDVTGGCAACGTAQGAGQAPAAGPAAMAPALLSGFARR